MDRVTVYCNACSHIFWEGSLLEWGLELSNPQIPKWFKEIAEHSKIHGKRHFKVKYPEYTVPLVLSLPIPH